jgi:hypothetical protein
VVLQDKSRCAECGWIGDTSRLLLAPNPFDVFSKEVIQGCPKCKQVECVEPVCDEPGCTRSVSCGVPTDSGYRHTCHEHDPSRKKDD